MTIHDHFDGEARCKQCAGPCQLVGDELAVTRVIRHSLELLVSHNFTMPPALLRAALIDLLAGSGLMLLAFWQRALDTK